MFKKLFKKIINFVNLPKYKATLKEFDSKCPHIPCHSCMYSIEPVNKKAVNVCRLAIELGLEKDYKKDAKCWGEIIYDIYGRDLENNVPNDSYYYLNIDQYMPFIEEHVNEYLLEKYNLKLLIDSTTDTSITFTFEDGRR